MSTTTIRTTTIKSVWCAPESEDAPYMNLRAIEQAFRACRKRKRDTVRACLYETQLLDNLVDTRDALQNGCWQPVPPVVFCVEKPKAREVYAAQFQDRVVHHLLVPWLEQLLDSHFIYDAASNRKGKGTHFAVNRLQSFMRSRQGKGWFLQLDIASFFNSIHQGILLEILSNKLQKAVRRGFMSLEQARQAYRLSQRIITQRVAEQAILIGHPRQFERIPPHKRLANSPAATGLPIGNLTSQFFANLYMNELDQFVKHQLKCRHYVRYVDDFILLHEEQAQLQRWQQQIADFLQQRLKLQLKAEFSLAPLSNGAEFLGYIVKPGYKLVRRRVLGNLHEKLQTLRALIVQEQAQGELINLKPDVREQLRAVLASYWGHLNHANTWRLREKLFSCHAWLPWLFLDAQQLTPRWLPASVSSFASQCRYFTQQYAGFACFIQKGRQWLCFMPGSKDMQIPIQTLGKHCAAMRRQRLGYAVITEQGYLRGGLKRRMLRLLWWPHSPPAVSLNQPAGATRHQLKAPWGGLYARS